jgi:2-hydroxy-6-oxonona-2,4-dienedioate hydrolase
MQSPSPSMDNAGHSLLASAKSIVLSQAEVSYIDTGVAPRPLAPAEPETPDSLLLLHGGHGGWQHWRENIPALSASYRVLAPDMPGFGDSTDLPVPSIAALAASMSELIDRLQLKRVAIVGFSFGCLVTTATALFRPDVIRKVLLINPPGLGERSEEAVRIHAEISDIARQQGRRAGVVQTMQRLMLKNHALISDLVLDDIESCVHKMRFYTRDISRGADLLAQLALLQQPLKVLIGRDDPYQRHELQVRKQRIESTTGVDCTDFVSDAAHWLQKDQPLLFNQTLQAFAAGLHKGVPHA